jgi:hypothetical protein
MTRKSAASAVWTGSRWQTRVTGADGIRESIPFPLTLARSDRERAQSVAAAIGAELSKQVEATPPRRTP